MDIERILMAVEREFGTSIKNKSDCLALEEEIFKKTNERLSYNTLRRAFGLVKTKTKISTASLNILAHYIGYRDFLEFRKVPEKEKAFFKFQLQSEVLKEEFHVNYAKNLIRPLDAQNILHLAYLLKFLLRDEKYRQVASILTLNDWLRINIHNYGVSMALANFVGRDFLDYLPSKWLAHFISKTYYPEVILSYFVPSLEKDGNFELHIRHLLRLARSNEQQVFAASLIGLWSFLRNEQEELLKNLAVCQRLSGSFKLFPVLEARILALEILAANNELELRAKKLALKERLKQQSDKRLFLFEMVTIFFVLQKDELVKELLAAVRNEKWRSNKWTNYGADQVFYIAEAYYGLEQKDLSRYIKYKQLIDKTNWHSALSPNLQKMKERLNEA